MKIEEIDFHICELESMEKYPQKLFFKGNSELLKTEKISIVGSRKPTQYARELTHKIASGLSAVGVSVVSGGAMGIDIIAHKSAGVHNTIMVAGTGLDKRYPAINKKVIQEIEESGLVLSQFQAGTPSARYNFPLRNELIVALGEALIVMYADEDSGTMRSVEYAQKMGKQIYVLPHRLGESSGTNRLLQNEQAKAIYDIDEFVSQFGDAQEHKSDSDDEFLAFCRRNPSYDEALAKYAQKVFEYELLGKVAILNARVVLL